MPGLFSKATVYATDLLGTCIVFHYSIPTLFVGSVAFDGLSLALSSGPGSWSWGFCSTRWLVDLEHQLFQAVCWEKTVSCWKDNLFEKCVLPHYLVRDLDMWLCVVFKGNWSDQNSTVKHIILFFRFNETHNSAASFLSIFILERYDKFFVIYIFQCLLIKSHKTQLE